jgi:hypothetical protein
MSLNPGTIAPIITLSPRSTPSASSRHNYVDNRTLTRNLKDISNIFDSPHPTGLPSLTGNYDVVNRFHTEICVQEIKKAFKNSTLLTLADNKEFNDQKNALLKTLEATMPALFCLEVDRYLQTLSADTPPSFHLNAEEIRSQLQRFGVEKSLYNTLFSELQLHLTTLQKQGISSYVHQAAENLRAVLPPVENLPTSMDQRLSPENLQLDTPEKIRAALTCFLEGIQETLSEANLLALARVLHHKADLDAALKADKTIAKNISKPIDNSIKTFTDKINRLDTYLKTVIQHLGTDFSEFLGPLTATHKRALQLKTALPFAVHLFSTVHQPDPIHTSDKISQLVGASRLPALRDTLDSIYKEHPSSNDADDLDPQITKSLHHYFYKEKENASEGYMEKKVLKLMSLCRGWPTEQKQWLAKQIFQVIYPGILSRDFLNAIMSPIPIAPPSPPPLPILHLGLSPLDLTPNDARFVTSITLQPPASSAVPPAEAVIPKQTASPPLNPPPPPPFHPKPLSPHEKPVKPHVKHPTVTAPPPLHSAGAKVTEKAPFAAAGLSSKEDLMAARRNLRKVSDH